MGRLVVSVIKQPAVVAIVPDWTVADNELAKALYKEVQAEQRLTCDLLPYAYRGMYKAIHRVDFLTYLFNGHYYSSKTVDFIASKLLSSEGNNHYPGDVFQLIKTAGWIEETNSLSISTWYQVAT